MPIWRNNRRPGDVSALMRRPSGVKVASGALDAPTANLELRWRADTGVVTGATMTWTDSIVGEVMSQSTASAQPTPNASNGSYNGQATLDFDGGDWLQDTGFAASIAQPWTLYVVGDATGATQIMVDDGGTGTNTAIYYSGGAWRYDAGTALVDTVAIGGVHGLGFEANGLSSKGFRDDFTTARVTGSAGTAAFASITAGAANTGGGPIVGSIAEILIYSATHATQGADVAAYLNQRYGLTL